MFEVSSTKVTLQRPPMFSEWIGHASPWKAIRRMPGTYTGYVNSMQN